MASAPTDEASSHGTGTDPAPVAAGRALAALRIYLGLVFLVAVWPKLAADGGFGGGLSGFVRNVGLEQAHWFYRPFLEGVVLPNAGLFALLVVTGEVVVALSLLSGLVTRLGAFVALLLTTNYLFTKGMWPWIPSSNDAAFMLISSALLVTGAGRTWGVDRILRRRWPGVPLW